MVLLALSREDFLTALTGQDGAQVQNNDSRSWLGAHDLTRRQRVELLSHVNLLAHLDSSALAALADRSVIDRWAEGDSIVRTGDEGDRFFVVLDGYAAVSIDTRPVNKLQPGDQFGEIALLHGVPRTADVVATSPVVTLSLHRDDFMPAVRSRLLLG